MSTPIRLAKKVAILLTVTSLLGTGNLAFADENTEATPKPTVILKEIAAPEQNNNPEADDTLEADPTDMPTNPSSTPGLDAEPTTIQDDNDETGSAATDEEAAPEEATFGSDTETLDEETAPDITNPEDEAGAGEAVVKDPVLRECVNAALGYANNSPVTAAHMKKLTDKLWCTGSKHISSLEGIQYATNVTSLRLYFGGNNFSPLTKLKSTKLTKLIVELVTPSKHKAVPFPDLSNLKKLDELIVVPKLFEYGNEAHRYKFSNYNNLSKLTSLTTLEISGTNLTNLSPVRKLTKLKYADFENNTIVDMTPLTYMNNLEGINLNHNRITVLPKPKVAMTNLQGIAIAANQIKDLRNASAWPRKMLYDAGEMQLLFRIKPSFKGGNTEIDISSFYDAGGKRPVDAYLAEYLGYSDAPYRVLSGQKGSIINNGKTARFSGKLKEGQIVYIKNTHVGGYFIRVGDSKVRKITLTPKNINVKTHKINAGSTFQIQAAVTPTDSLNTKVTWKSSNSNVAAITSSTQGSRKNGIYTANIKALEKGTATITAIAQDGSGVKASWKVTVLQACTQSGERAMYRMYNPASGEHLYTADTKERDILAKKHKWHYEGIAWIAPKTSSTPIYRLYNPGLGDHHYTTNKNEVTALTKKHGWVNEGIGWHSAACTKNIPVYRQYNPRLRIGQHHYTVDKNEYTINNSRNGWKGEGIAWYALRKK